MRVWTIILPEIRSRMPKDTRRTDAARDVESLEDLVYRPRISTGNQQVRSANPMIAVPLTLLGYLALGGLGWQIVRHSRSLLVEIPKSIAVDLVDIGEGDAPQVTPAPLPAAGGPPPGAIEKPDAPPPPIPASPDEAPEKPPTELPTQDLSGVAFPAQPSGGPSGTGTGSGPESGGTGEGTGASGTGQGPRVVVLEYSAALLIFKPTIPGSEYPKIARAARVQGTVMVDLLVGVDGIPVSAHAYEGPSMLRTSAEAIGMRYRFKPEIRDGVPVMIRFSVPIVYRMN